MATKFYGKCTGSAASKYDLWISATQNSQSISANQSNVTLNFYLKRNDGYADSAYNLYAEQNSVRLLVGGVERVSKNLKIDTRNGATVLLCSWTGNINHSPDGTLSVNISGSFTINGTKLSGGSASGALVCSTIPRSSSASFSATSVNPGSQIVATVSTLASNFNHKIKWQFQNEAVTQSLENGVLKSTFTVPSEWASKLTDSSKGNVSVSLYTYNGTKLVGTKAYSINFIIPETDEYKPSFELKLSRHDYSVPAQWEELVQNVSTITLEYENLQLKYGAALASVVAAVGSASVKKSPATFELVAAGEVEVSLCIKDTRGFTAVRRATITVQPYTPPSVNIKRLFRCNAQGVEETYGTYLALEYDLAYSSVNGKNQGTLAVCYKLSDEADYSSPVNATANPFIFGDGNISPSSSAAVRFVVGDSLSQNSQEITRSVASANIPFNIKKGGKGAAFGKFAEQDNELSLGWNLTVDGSVSVKGKLLCEAVSCVGTEITKELVGAVKYYPCLNGCLVRIRVKPNMLLSPGISHHIATISEKTPGIFTPLACMVNLSSGGQSSAGIAYETGNVYVRSDTEISENANIYISGFYFAE